MALEQLTQEVTQDHVLKSEAKNTIPESLHYGDWPNDTGFHAPVETPTLQELKVTGTIPAWAAGTLVRAGPGARKVSREKPGDGEFECSHWFDGFAHIHKFEIVPETDGVKVHYQSRGQVDETMELVRRSGRLPGITFGQKRDPCDTLFMKIKTAFSPFNSGGLNRENICVAIQQVVGSGAATSSDPSKGSSPRMLSVTTDKNGTKEFDVETLEPKGLTNQTALHPELSGALSGAHACIDEKTGDFFNYNLDIRGRATWRIFKTSGETGKTEILATICDARIRAAYIHSMLMSEHYIILCVWPAYIAKMGFSVLWERNIIDAMEKFDKKATSTWIIVDRNGQGVVQKFTSPAMFCFHTVNAWEERRLDGGVDIVADLCTLKDTAILQRFYYDNMVSNSRGAHKYRGEKGIDTEVSLSRFKLANINEARTQPTLPEAELLFNIPTPKAGELPIINPHYRMAKHRYVYSVTDRGASSFLDSIGKTDTATEETIWWSEDKCTPSEPIFVPNPEGSAEDDGVLLTVVLDGVQGSSFLLCLDARDLTEMGRAHCEVAVGIGFHGLHVPLRT